MKKFKGSWAVFWIWMFVFFPMAIVYWAVKQE